MKIITIKKSERKKTYKKKLEKIDVPGLDVKKYLGKLKITDDPLDIQKRLRDEWK